jgi:hypothetical protein
MEFLKQRHKGDGLPNAIVHYERGLNNRQKMLLNSLPIYGSRAAVPKNKAKMSDLAALTAIEEVEFAMFTKGQVRLLNQQRSVVYNSVGQFRTFFNYSF